jgi:nitroreductase
MLQQVLRELREANSPLLNPQPPRTLDTAGRDVVQSPRVHTEGCPGVTDPEEAVDLFEAILARRSVRRYDARPLDAATLGRVRQIVDTTCPLVAANHLYVAWRDDLIRQDLAAVLGGYGRLITPPHALAPYIVGDRHALTDLGYRVEQIVVRMAALGIGSCYIGTLPKEDAVRAMLGIPTGGRIGALLVFGRPSSTVGGQAVNNLIRSALGGDREPDLTRIFFHNNLDNPAHPPDVLRPLVLAAARAPSACNAQPWRFVWHADQLWLFVTRHNPKYGGGPSEQYCLYDAGIAMANVMLAMEARGISGTWQMHQPDDAGVPTHPGDLLPIASLRMA